MTLFDQILGAASAERARRAHGRHVVSRDECPPEMTPMGTLRWYLHPTLEAPSTRSLYFYELELPPRGASGLLFCQGGIVHYVLSGSGYTEVDGTPHEWEAGDAIAIPIKEDGVRYRHVNTSGDVVRILAAWPNLDSSIGPEGGVAMAVEEAATAHFDPR